MLSVLDRSSASDTGDHGTLLRRLEEVLLETQWWSLQTRVSTRQQTPNWSLSPISLVPILCGDDPPTCESCGLQLSEAHISGMNEPAGHLCKIFHNLFYQRIVSKHWQSYHYSFYQRNPFYYCNFCYFHFILTLWPWLYTLQFYHLLVIIWFYFYSPT